MRALVTGGAGFIGSHLTEALVQRKNSVRVLDSLLSGRMANLSSVRHKIEFIRGDIRDIKTLKKAIQGVDVVFHQAALRSVPKSVGSPMEYHDVNTTATLNLLLLARDSKVKRVVFASSSSVYGDDTPLPQKETMKPTPQSPYACSKLAAEINCVMFHRLYGVEAVGLRYFNVYGPRQSIESEYAVVVPKFTVSLLSSQAPPIYGDGLQTRDFTYVGDIVQANLKAAMAPKAAGEVFNVASGRRYSVKELARILAKQIGVDTKPRLLPARAGDVRHTWADISKARRLMGYRPTMTFSKGLAHTLAWFRQHREAWTEQ